MFLFLSFYTVVHVSLRKRTHTNKTRTKESLTLEGDRKYEISILDLVEFAILCGFVIVYQKIFHV